MAGKTPVAATDEQRRALMALSRSRDRGEADRARAIWLTLSGWTSGQIAEAFGVREDTVRFWRSTFITGGIEALKKSVALGPAPVKAECARAVAGEVLSGPVADRRRRLLTSQAEAGDIVLLVADESEALTHPYLAHVWAKKGADLRVPAPGQRAKVAMLGVLDWARRDLIVHTSRTKRSSDFIALLEEIDRRYGPRLGVVLKPVVLVLD